jgi:hypothetical protein
MGEKQEAERDRVLELTKAPNRNDRVILYSLTAHPPLDDEHTPKIALGLELILSST